MTHDSERTALENGIVELREDVSDSIYYNPDLAPTRWTQRKWGLKDFAVLWISMSACIPTYMLASALVDKTHKGSGMNWWQAVLTIFLGNVVVLIPMVLNAHAGTKYGIPFPIYCRAPFGIRGANVPALLRALVACGWFGIQTWIGGEAIYKILQKYFTAWKDLPPLSGLEIDLEKFTALPLTLTIIPHLGINLPQLACFLFFWGINMFVIYRGIDSIRFLLNIKAPLLIVLGLALLGWAYHSAHGFGNMLAQPSLFEAGGSRQGQFWLYFFPALTANVGFWATLALNIPDFTRFSRSQREQIAGQALGLPATMGLYSFIGVAVTSGAYVIYPHEEQGKLWDPTYLLTLFENPVILVVALVSLSVATLATNIAANVVSPANDFAHVWPRMISFRTGGFLTGVIGILIMPWKLLANPAVYINKWLIGYSSLLGAVGGVLIADYFLIRRTRLDLPGLYRQKGPYWYNGGFNPRALIALVAGIAPCIPGFVYQVTTPPDQDLVVNFWTRLYSYAWFVSFGFSFAIYVVLMCFPVPSRPAPNN